MRLKSFFIVSLLLFTFSGKAQYFMTKNDFIETYQDTARPSQLILRKVPEEKLLAGYYYVGTQLKLFFNDDSQKTIFSKSVKISGDSVEATEITKFWHNKRPTTFDLNNLDSVSIRKMWISWTTPYFDIDSLENRHTVKTDSLEQEYASKNRFYLELVPLNRDDSDTIRILENACYSLDMADGEEFRYGVIEKITLDSLVISKRFSPEELAKDDNDDYRYAHADIKRINLLKSGGVGNKSVPASDYTITLLESPKDFRYSPCWYSISRVNGTLNFYRLLLTENGFKGISFKEGKYFWFEG